MSNTKAKISEFTAKGFRKNPYQSILLAASIGLLLMSLGILAGLDSLFSMILLLGGIILVLLLRSGKITYYLTSEGIGREIVSSIVDVKSDKEFWLYSDIDSYVIQKDLARSLEEYHELKIKLKKEPGKLLIQTKTDEKNFRIFCDHFEKQVSLFNDSDHKADDERLAPVILKKKPFYKTIAAKLLTVFFVLMTIALLLFLILGRLSPAAVFRLGIIIFPGTLYMVYRVYLNK